MQDIKASKANDITYFRMTSLRAAASAISYERITMNGRIIILLEFSNKTNWKMKMSEKNHIENSKMNVKM